MKKSNKLSDTYAMPKQVMLLFGLMFVAVWVGMLLSNVSKKYQTATVMHATSATDRDRLQQQLQNLEEQISELESDEGRALVEKNTYRILDEGENVLIFVNEDEA